MSHHALFYTFPMKCRSLLFDRHLMATLLFETEIRSLELQGKLSSMGIRTVLHT